MKPRLDIARLAPELFHAVTDLGDAVRKSGFDSQLLHLIRVRASQLNGCVYCVDLHVREALADGLSPQLLHHLAVWRESPLFDERQKAALQWTESITLIAQTGVPDSAFAAVKAAFTETEIAQLTIAISTINAWNMITASSRMQHPAPKR